LFVKNLLATPERAKIKLIIKINNIIIKF